MQVQVRYLLSYHVSQSLISHDINKINVCILQTEAVNGTGYFSAVCWLFGRGLFDYLGYPIGMYPVLLHAINLTNFHVANRQA